MTFVFAILFIEGTIFGWFSVYLGSKKEFGWYVEPTKSSTPIDQGVQKVLQFDYGHQQSVTIANDQTAEVILVTMRTLLLPVYAVGTILPIIAWHIQEYL